MTPTIRRKPFGAGTFGVTAAPQSLGVPAAAYPGRIATNSDLIVAVDRQQTSLLLPLQSTDTAMTVIDASKIVAYSLLSIDNEIVKTTGPPAGNVVAISRGFDGTAAALHLSGAIVAGLVDAYHHNALVAEVEAIEAFMGPNGQNITGGNLPFLVSSSFDFTPQSPGGSLAPGNNVITLTPVPKGVNGSDTGHYLYISGGTGAAEAVPITGGTAVSGGASGTVIVNCANSHSGAWTIRTATGGIQEAVNYAVDGASILIPTDMTLNASVVANGKSVAIRKFASVSIGNAATYRIFTSKNSWGVTAKEETISTDGIALAGASSADTVPFAGNPLQAAAVSAARSTNHNLSASTSEECMWVQEDFNGTTGTPVALRGVLFTPNLTGSLGATAVAGYAYLGWTNNNLPGSGTEGIGVHGQCDAYNGAPGHQNVCVGVNAEGSHIPLGTDPGPTPIIIGVVSNTGAANAGNATMIGVEVISNPNPGATANTEGGIKVHAATNGTHQYGLKIYDDGGQYLQPVAISTSQSNAPAINISNTNSSLGTASSSINFYRGDFLATHQLASISVSNISDYGTGVLRIATASGSTLTTVVTVDQAQVVTVAKSIRTTPIPVAQLPPSASNIGSWACVNDATVTTVGTPVAGGGANTVAVFCGNAGWKIVAS